MTLLLVGARDLSRLPYKQSEKQHDRALSVPGAADACLSYCLFQRTTSLKRRCLTPRPAAGVLLQRSWGRPAAGVEEQHPVLVKAAQAAFRPVLGFSPIATRQREVRLQPMQQGAGQLAEGACMHRVRCLQCACRSGIRGRLRHRWRLSCTSTPPVMPSYLQANYAYSGGCRRLEACGLQLRSGPTALMSNITGYIQRSTLNSYTVLSKLSAVDISSVLQSTGAAKHCSSQTHDK